jgi:hypothetical protein
MSKNSAERCANHRYGHAIPCGRHHVGLVHAAKKFTLETLKPKAFHGV